ncbi:MAG: methyltransferase domain-containing protein [Vicinamibacterales bacterium]
MAATAHIKTRDEIAAAYASPPLWYDVRGFFILTFAYNSTLPRQLRFFGANMGPRHLELACGSGTLLGLTLLYRRLKRLPMPEISAADYAESMLAGAIRRFRGNSRVDVRLADAAALPYPDASFHTVNVANAVHCFPDIDGALREIRRVLKPGGTLAVNVLLYPRTPWPLNRIAQRLDEWGIRKGILFTPYEQEDVLRRVAAAGLDVRSTTISGNCLELLASRP